MKNGSQISIERKGIANRNPQKLELFLNRIKFIFPERFTVAADDNPRNPSPDFDRIRQFFFG